MPIANFATVQLPNPFGISVMGLVLITALILMPTRSGASEASDRQGDLLYQRLLNMPGVRTGSGDTQVVEALQKWVRYYEHQQDRQRAIRLQRAVLEMQLNLQPAGSVHVREAEQHLLALQAGTTLLPANTATAKAAQPSHNSTPALTPQPASAKPSVNQSPTPMKRHVAPVTKPTPVMQPRTDIKPTASTTAMVPDKPVQALSSARLATKPHVTKQKPVQPPPEHPAVSRSSPAPLAHPDTVKVQALVAQAEQAIAQRNYPKADQRYKQALRLQERVSGKQHIEVARLLQQHAALYRRQKAYGPATSLYQRSQSIISNADSHSLMDVKMLNTMAEFYEEIGSYAKAASLYRQGLKITEQIAANDHSTLTHILTNLARLYFRQGELNKAITTTERTVTLLEKAYPNGNIILDSERDSLRYMLQQRKSLQL